MANLIFKRTGEMIGVCNNAETIEIIQYNVDGNGSFIFIGDGKIGIAPKTSLNFIK